MEHGTCLRCGSTEVYRREGGVVDPGGGPLFIRGWKLLSLGRGPLLDTLACGACGYVVLEVPQGNLDELRTTFQKGGWTRVGGGK